MEGSLRSSNGRCLSRSVLECGVRERRFRQLWIGVYPDHLCLLLKRHFSEASVFLPRSLHSGSSFSTFGMASPFSIRWRASSFLPISA